MKSQWWLRTSDEVFGPVSRENLLEWAELGRIQPGQDVSEDGETWTPATAIPFLDMRWSIDIGDGTPRGPFNKRAAQALLTSGRLPSESRLVEVAPAYETETDPEPGAETGPEPDAESGPEPDAETVSRTALAAAQGELAELRAQVETLRTGLRAAEDRAAAAESRAAAAQRETAAVRAEKDSELAAAQRETAAVRAEKDSELAAAQSMKQAAESNLAELASAKQAAEAAYEGRIQSLNDELARLPPTAQLAANAQAAVYALMREEADELAAALDAEQREAEQFRAYRRARTERLQARRQEILRHIGTDAEDMTRRALIAHPEDPRTAQMRQELDALRVLQERSALESERKIRDLSTKLRDSLAEAKRLREQAADVTVIYRQLQEAREKLMRREKELVEERQRAEAERQQNAASQQALLARLSSLEMGMPGATNQSREARNVRLAPWMGLKK